jgi:peptidoglycan/LPS O-acetylase OafA/YrhL
MSAVPPSTTQDVKRLHVLDGFRGIAAMGVAAFHVAPNVDWLALCSRMYLFVDFFFILSGFVLNLAFAPKFENGMKGMPFLRLRVRRLWPTVALGAVLGGLAAVSDGSPTTVLLLVVFALLMVPFISTGHSIYPLNAPQWSILWEWIANFFHAAVLHHLADRTLLLLSILCGAAFLASILWTGHADLGATESTWWMALPRIGWTYLLGIWMARRWQRPFGILPWYICLLLPIVVLLALPKLPLSHGVGDALFCIGFVPPMFWLLTHATLPKMAEAPLGAIGALSFPLYAIHIPVIFATRAWSGGNAFDAMALAAALILAGLVAWFGPLMRKFITNGVGRSDRKLA